MKKVTYKGKTIESVYEYEMTNEKYHELVNEYYKKPPIESVKKQMKTIHRGGVAIRT